MYRLTRVASSGMAWRLQQAGIAPAATPAVAMVASPFLQSFGRRKYLYMARLKHNKVVRDFNFLKKRKFVHSKIWGACLSRKCVSFISYATTKDSCKRASEFLKDKNLVPESAPPSDEQLTLLYNFVQDSRKLVVLTGAGISTECGIPDYRSPHGAYSSGFKPITHQEFVRSVKNQRRYWARSYAGWQRFIGAQPGPVHKALATLETRGWVYGMITQNVDRLHNRAGSSPIELHGTTHSIMCLDCNSITCRHAFHDQVKSLNPEWVSAIEKLEKGDPLSDASFGMQQRPDGDIEIDEKFWEDNFHIPSCDKCGGVLKPNVVFFGDSVPKERADKAMATVNEGDALLVLGSSLMTMSAYRLARVAYEVGSPIALINIGPTRADNLSSLKIEARCGEVLSRLLSMGILHLPRVL